jgi:cytochrome c oxidase cbb3-type subunit 3
MWRELLVVCLVMALSGAAFLVREEHSYSTTPAAQASRSDQITMTNLYAGGKPAASLPGPKTGTHEDFTAFDVSEGKRLYHWFNCSTCHANGGGDIGPPLMDKKWLYGAEPRNIFATIIEGRPNGMPSFRGKFPDEQVWQIVAYIRSMSGHVPVTATPGRNDDLQAKPPETMAPKKPVVNDGSPGPDRRSTTP